MLLWRQPGTSGTRSCTPCTHHASQLEQGQEPRAPRTALASNKEEDDGEALCTPSPPRPARKGRTNHQPPPHLPSLPPRPVEKGTATPLSRQTPAPRPLLGMPEKMSLPPLALTTRATRERRSTLAKSRSQSAIWIQPEKRRPKHDETAAKT
jgi:hypothetical protein